MGNDPQNFFARLGSAIQAEERMEELRSQDARDKTEAKLRMELIADCRRKIQLACPPEVWPLVSVVIDDPNFQRWSGSGSPKKHHYGTCGLLVHTTEVVCHVAAAAKTHAHVTKQILRVAELIVAAVWHDYGKMWDYQEKDGVWGKFNNHAREIHHVTRSVMQFQRFLICGLGHVELPADFNPDHVVHIILAHHGRREWGSPVSPHTPEAWLLHLADAMSARLNDHATHPVD